MGDFILGKSGLWAVMLVPVVLIVVALLMRVRRPLANKHILHYIVLIPAVVLIFCIFILQVLLMAGGFRSGSVWPVSLFASEVAAMLVLIFYTLWMDDRRDRGDG